MTVERWDKSLVYWYGTGQPDLRCPARVTLNGSTLQVVAKWRGGRVLSYGGDEVRPGFFVLKADHGGRATLHRRPDNPDHLEGSWIETNPADEGMWSVLLDRDE